MYTAVMPSTQEDQVGENCRTAIGPGLDVMRIGPGRRIVAAREPTTLVEHAQRPMLRARDHAAGGTDLRRLRSSLTEDRGEHRVAGPGGARSRPGSAATTPARLRPTPAACTRSPGRPSPRGAASCHQLRAVDLHRAAVDTTPTGHRPGAACPGARR